MHSLSLSHSIFHSLSYFQLNECQLSCDFGALAAAYSPFNYNKLLQNVRNFAFYRFVKMFADAIAKDRKNNAWNVDKNDVVVVIF